MLYQKKPMKYVKKASASLEMKKLMVLESDEFI